MDQLNQPIGILGGTFDPVHMGHLRMALEIQQTLRLATVHLIPCDQPVHRQQPIASATDRFTMLQSAVQYEETLVADDRELKRGGPSYTIDTLIAMREEFPTSPLCLMMGIDAFLGFPSWNRFTDILNYAHLVIAYRPQFQLPMDGMVAELVKTYVQHENNYVHEHLAGSILLRQITSLDISASDIRKQIAMGGNPRYLLPDDVYNYIQQNGVYFDEIRKHT